MVGPLYGSTIKNFNGMTNKPFFLTVCVDENIACVQKIHEK